MGSALQFPLFSFKPGCFSFVHSLGGLMITQVRPDSATLATLQSSFNKPWVTITGVIILLLVLEGQLLDSVRQESLTWDEGDHIFAGYMSLKHHEFGLNPEHPPLVTMIAAIPLHGIHLPEPQF